MNPDASTHKKKALRLGFLYPGIFLGLVVLFGSFASLSTHIDPQTLRNAVRGMTACTLGALSLAYIGYLEVKKSL